MSYHRNTSATFRPLDAAVARELAEFAARRRNIGRSVDIAGKSYTLEHVSRSSSSYFRSRGLSLYFRVGRSIVRISDHWSRSRHHERSRKLNCGRIGSCSWSIHNRAADLFWYHGHGGGRYPFQMLAGICGVNGFAALPVADR